MRFFQIIAITFPLTSGCGDATLVGTTPSEIALPVTAAELQASDFSITTEKTLVNAANMDFAITATSPGKLAGVTKLRISSDICQTGDYQDFNGSTISWPINQNSLNTTFRVYVQFIIGEDFSSCFNTEIDVTHDNTAPTLEASITTTDSTSTTYTISITSPEANSEIAVFTTACDTEPTWVAAAESVNVELTAGLSSVYVLYRDQATNRSECKQLWLPGAGGSVTVSIDSGNAYSTTGSLTITLTGTSNIAQYRIAATADCSSPGDWVTVPTPATTVDVAVTATISTEGETYNASAIVKNEGGAESTCGTDSIILDGTAPTATIAIAAGAEAAARGSMTVTNTLTGTATEMNVSTTASCGGSWVTYADTVSVSVNSLGTGTVYGQFRDAAGNTSSCVSDTITAIPNGTADSSFTANGGALSLSGTLKAVIRQGSLDYIVGVSTNGSTIRLSRISSTGAIDSSFTHDISDDASATGKPLAVDSNNQVYLIIETASGVTGYQLPATGGGLNSSWGSSGSQASTAGSPTAGSTIFGVVDSGNKLWAIGRDNFNYMPLITDSSGGVTYQSSSMMGTTNTFVDILVTSNANVVYIMGYDADEIMVMSYTTTNTNSNWNSGADQAVTGVNDNGSPKMVLNSSNQVIVASTRDTNSTLNVARFNASDENLDTSFDGADGIVTFGSSISALRTLNINSSDLLITCYRGSSSLDYCATISSTGSVTETFYTAPSGLTIAKVLADSHGNYYIVGDGSSGVELHRITSTGTTDSTFSHTAGSLAGTFLDAFILSDGAIAMVNTSGTVIKVQ